MELLQLKYGVKAPHSEKVLVEQKNYLTYSLNHYILKDDTGKEFVSSEKMSLPQVLYLIKEGKLDGELYFTENDELIEKSLKELESKKPKPRRRTKAKVTKEPVKKEESAPVEVVDSKDEEKEDEA